jgi:hypothetical protein
MSVEIDFGAVWSVAVKLPTAARMRWRRSSLRHKIWVEATVQMSVDHEEDAFYA